MIEKKGRLLLLFCIFTKLSCTYLQTAAYDYENDLIDIRDYGMVGDGETDNSEAFRQAFNDISSGNGTDIIIPYGNFFVDSIAFPDNVTLVFRNGGKLHVPENGQIHINGTIEARIQQIFSGKGSVTGNLNNLYVYPQWFGARGDGIHNDAPALQQSADLAAQSMGNTLFIPAGEYLFLDDIVFKSNIENRGLLVKEIKIDEERTQFSLFTFTPTHHPKTNPHITFAPDHEEMELEAEYFYGIEEGETELPVYRNVPLADGSDDIDLETGGTLRFYSSDFFSSRNNSKGDQYYDKNDISQIVSPGGSLFPGLAFSYPKPPDAETWSQDAVYRKGDYVEWEGELFKATWPSGEGSVFQDRFLGTVNIGPVQPRPGAATTQHEFTFDDGSEDRISIWRRVETRVWYRQKDRPLTINGLRVEVRLKNHEQQTKRIMAGAVVMNRSNMTFNNLEVTVRDREATMARLLNSTQAVNVEFNNGFFSGATYHGLGYNILNWNVANFRYNHTVSVNSRKGMDGRHGKNITVNGGHFNVIDDHYGRNYIIRDVVMSGRSTYIPRYATPDANLQEWSFRTIRPFGFAGSNIHIENVTINGGAGGIFSARSDIGDLYGTIEMRNVTVRRNEGDVPLFNHSINPGFDFASKVRVPGRVIIEDVYLENPGRFTLNIGNGFDGGTYGPVHIRETSPIGKVYSSSSMVTFSNCIIDNAEFDFELNSMATFRGCTFLGNNTGLHKKNIKHAVDNILDQEAQESFPNGF